MKITKKLLTFIIVSALFATGCGENSVEPHRNYYAPNLKHQNSSYLPNKTHHMSVANSMSSLDHQSQNTRPTLIYSNPKNSGGNNNLIAPIRFKILSYINNVRSRGTHCGPAAPPLGWSDRLEEAAVAHAIDMETNHFLSHLGSGTEYDVARKGTGQGSNFYERILHFGYPIKAYELAGEIISYTKYKIIGSKDPNIAFKHAIENFIKSPSHCKILMNPRFHDVGIAAYKDQEKIYWVIEFAEVHY